LSIVGRSKPLLAWVCGRLKALKALKALKEEELRSLSSFLRSF